MSTPGLPFVGLKAGTFLLSETTPLKYLPMNPHTTSHHLHKLSELSCNCLVNVL